MAVARGVAGKNNFHEHFSPEFRHLKTIFPIFFGKLFFRILVSFGPIPGLAGPLRSLGGSLNDTISTKLFLQILDTKSYSSDFFKQHFF